jgi:type I restriction enzyme, S subunit
MGSEWQNYKLGDLGSFRNGANFSKKDYGPGFPIVNVKQLYAYRYVETDNLLEVSSKAISNPESLFLQNGDILFARSSVKGSGAGQAAMIFSCPEHTIFSGFIIRFRTEAKDIALPLFINYLLRSDIYRELLPRIASGTTITNLSQGTLASLPIPLPSLPEQRAIAHILGSLDDKIELNRQMNQTLEATARAIFKSWFVDFDPVRAKAEGRPTGLPDEIAALFPDSFEDSAIGEIPKGWEIFPLSEFLNIIGGGTPKTRVEEYWGGDIPWFSVVDAPSETDVFVIDTEKHVTQLGVDKSSTKVLRKGTTIISARGTVGKCALVGCPMAMNQSCYGIQSKNGESDYFVYFTIRSQVADLQRSGHGSVFNTITRDTFKTIRIACPPTKLTTSYEKIVHPVMELILANLHENATLTSLRDTLLPKLISGELRVPDAEKFIEEVSL